MIEDVPTPEWGGVVRVRALTAAERERFALESLEAPRLAQVRLVALAAVDETGAPLFGPEDVERLGEKAAAPLWRLAAAVRRLSGMEAKAPPTPPEMLQAILRPRAEVEVSTWARWHEETGNPLFAWQAYRAARRGGLPLPAGVLAYLDGAAEALCTVAEEPPAARDRGDAVALSLGLRKGKAGQGGPFQEYQKRKRDLAVALDVAEGMADGGKEYIVREAVAKKHGLSPAQVRTVYRNHCKKFYPM
jgi:hypothetical protein